MRVKIHGPNLARAAEEKGTFHVHAADCQDNRHYGYGRKYGGEDSGFELNADCKFDAVDFIYGPDAGDFDGYEYGDTGGSHYGDFYFAPCVDLPAALCACGCGELPGYCAKLNPGDPGYGQVPQ